MTLSELRLRADELERQAQIESLVNQADEHMAKAAQFRQQAAQEATAQWLKIRRENRTQAGWVNYWESRARLYEIKALKVVGGNLPPVGYDRIPGWQQKYFWFYYGGNYGSH